jgi:GT2 family glycosyltransferase
MFNQSMFFRRSVFADGQLLDERQKHYMDHEFFWRLALAGYRFEYVPEIDAYFRIHDAAKGVTQVAIEATERFALYASILRQKELPFVVRQKAAESMRWLCRVQFAQSRWELFDQLVREMRRMLGTSALGPGLIGRYALTCLGGGNIQRLRRLALSVRRHPQVR